MCESLLGEKCAKHYFLLCCHPRFAKFVQGESHLDNEEMIAYGSINLEEDELFTEDEDY